MKYLRISLLIMGSTAVVGLFIWLGFSLFGKYRTPVSSPLNAIPANTAVVIQLNNAGEVLEKFHDPNTMLGTLGNLPLFNGIHSEFSRLEAGTGLSAGVRDLFRKNTILVTITLSGHSSFGALYLSALSDREAKDEIEAFLQKTGSTGLSYTTQPYATTNIYRITGQGAPEPFYATVYNGVFAGSFHSDLVQRAIDRLSLNTPGTGTAGFRKVQAAAESVSGVNLFINYRYFSMLLSKMTDKPSLEKLIRFSTLAEWTGLDLSVRTDELLMAGITTVGDTTRHFLSLFNGQTPQKRVSFQIVPSEAVTYYSYGWSDPSSFSLKLQERPSIDDSGEDDGSGTANTALDIFGTDVGQYFFPWLGQEGCVFSTGKTRNREASMYAALVVKDSAVLFTSLRMLADTLQLRLDSTTVRRHRVFKMPYSTILNCLFGETFGEVDAGCCVYLNGFAIFSKAPQDLDPLIKAVTDGTTLANSSRYQNMSETMSDQSNIYAYINLRKAATDLSATLLPEYTGNFSGLSDSLAKFESLTMQLSKSEDQWFTSVSLRYRPGEEQEESLQWKASLDTTIIGRPRILPFYPNGRHFVFVQDLKFSLYCLNRNGRTEWKTTVDGPVLSDFRILPVSSVDSVCLVFNTAEHLYALRPDGTAAANYPMSFPSRATSGITVADWDGNGQIQVFIAFEDNKIHSFTLDGNPVAEWQKPVMENRITEPVLCIQSGLKDFILVSDTSGKLMLLDRFGHSWLPEGVQSKGRSYGNPMTHLLKNGRDAFLSTDRSGQLIYLYENGETETVRLKRFSPGHRFFYTVPEGVNDHAFVYYDKNKLWVYNRRRILEYSYDLKETTGAPVLLPLPGGKTLIGMTAAGSGAKFLFDGSGLLPLPPGIKGNSEFDIGRLEGINRLNLVTGSGRVVKNYRLPEL